MRRKVPVGKFFVGVSVLLTASLLLALVIFVNLEEGQPSATILNEQDHPDRSYRSLQNPVHSHKTLLNQIENGTDVSKKEDANVENEPYGGKSGRTLQTNELCSSAHGVHILNKSDVNTFDILQTLARNLSADYWKQPWNIKVDQKRFVRTSMNRDKLRVFLVPFSFNNPGGMDTLELNYARYTRQILEVMMQNLVRDQRLKFVWSEVSMFSVWWKTLPLESRHHLKKVITNGQLEFVSGGWVTADQTSSHFYSLLIQLIEGRRWLHQHFGVVPLHAMEPYGLSQPMAYFLARVGTRFAVIQKAHHSLKRYLSGHKQLEFKWRQVWGNERRHNDLFCHLMPFSSYDTMHTCGPDPAICYNFDFKRMFPIRGTKAARPSAITTENVKQRSEQLLDMYRKKAMLFKTNVLLVPLGDDFAWGSQREWDAQMGNYTALISYINSIPGFNAHVQLGTLKDYFSELQQEISERSNPPVLTGDISPYFDLQKGYWSQSFSSRPFLKEMDRDLMAHLRSAQIAFALMCAEISRRYSTNVMQTSPYISWLHQDLVITRRHLSLFQHHSAISGTARDHVMNSHAKRLFDGLKRSNHVLEKCLDILTHINDPTFSIGYAFEQPRRYSPTYDRESHYTLPRYNVMEILEIDSLNMTTAAQLYTVFNPTIQKRTQLVTIYVPMTNVVAVDLEDEVLQSEIFPVFQSGKEFSISQANYQLSVLVRVKPLSVKNFRIKQIIDTNTRTSMLPSVFMKSVHVPKSAKFLVLPLEAVDDSLIKISNEYMSVLFDCTTGLATGIEVYGKLYPFKIGFLTYNLKHYPGMHIFKHQGPANTILNSTNPSAIIVVEGRLKSYVEVYMYPVVHRLTVYSSGGIDSHSVEITNVVDIHHESNAELIMRINTGIHSEDISYTDLNGFQASRRKRVAKLPIQTNYYPMSSYTFIEDAHLRVTLIGKQPLGTASLASGEMEVMLDRRVGVSDIEKNVFSHRGITDNVQTQSTFKILFEKQTCRDKNKIKKPAMLSLASHVALQSLHHPLQTFSFIADHRWNTDGVSDFDFRQYPQDFACDIQLVDMPMLQRYDDGATVQNESFVGAGLLVHRVGFDGTYLEAFQVPECTCESDRIGRFRLTEWIGSGVFKPEFQKMSLSFTQPQGRFYLSNSSVLLKPMEIYAFLLTFR